MTYGAIVAQVVKEHGSAGGAEVSVQLERLGYGMGVRLIDEFFARTALPRCKDLRETADTIARVAFKMYLGVSATVSKFDAKKQSFRLTLDENPLVPSSPLLPPRSPVTLYHLYHPTSFNAVRVCGGTP